ncbi:hypothetical protein N9Q43_00260 [bacterium]|nr:hypothetical protein [bacterium]
MENVKCKLSFKHWDEKVSVKRGYSDITLPEFYQMCIQLALAAGFKSSNVIEQFGEQ